MEIKINKEIRDYTESVFFGLSLRQFACALAAVGAAVGCFFGLRNIVGTDVVTWLCLFAAAPFAALGFVKYNGMTAEQLAMAWLRSEWFLRKPLPYLKGGAMHD
ncbi:MAG: PrgI family protein [Oscillospiraceae bacterium]|nr:PrgI family protein [Oscillospiraceae bacterium]